MVHRALRTVWSLLKFWWVLFREPVCIVHALLRSDRKLAAERARVLAISTHDDMLSMIGALQRLLPLWSKPAIDIERVLVVKLDRIGDMVATTPVFDVLRTAFPKARLDVVGHPAPLSLLDGDERIAERMPYKSWLYHAMPVKFAGPRTWLLVWRLLWRRYPLIVYLRGSFPFLLLGLTSRLAPAKFKPGEPVIQRYLNPLETLLGPLPHPDPCLHIDAGGASFARELLGKTNGRANPRVVIHAAASAATKMWPPERFAEVADQLVERYAAQVHFLGSSDDRAMLMRIGQLAVHEHAIHCTLNLPQVVAVLATCDLFIGNDSGLSHIAAAVKTPTVVLWGPANLSMARPKAPAERCTILYHDLSCREACPETRCVNPIQLECLMQIQTADVLEAAGRHLQVAPIGRIPLPLAGFRGRQKARE
jgi:ADP-heptose:LPS heptosyltransferase